MRQKGISVQQAEEIKKRKNYRQTKLEKLRVAQNMSQSKLATLSGVTLRSIQCYEQRTREIDGARINTLLGLCTALNCSLCDILEEQETIEKLMHVVVASEININAKESDLELDDERLVKKYIQTEIVPELTDDQRNGIAFISQDFRKEWKEILEQRYIERLTLEAIAKKRGVTKERIRQVTIKAIAKLREYEKSDYTSMGLETAHKKSERMATETPFFERSIDELGLSNRARNCLMRAGCEKIGEVILAQNELIHIRNIGVHVMAEIDEKIKSYTQQFLEGRKRNV